MSKDSEKHQIQRLKEEQCRALKESEIRRSALEKFKNDYEMLSDRLRTLPNKVTHDVMVPFGSLAFMPGELIHTNEIMVLLGDNWFVERSAMQACDIITRRIKGIEENISSLEKQKSLLEPRLNFTSDLQNMAEARGDMMEIKEEYDAEKEKTWREQHKKNVQKYRRKEKELRQQVTIKETIKEKTDESEAELWSRLDELEKLELEGDEMNRMTTEDRLAWEKDEGACVSESSADTESEEEDEEEETESGEEAITPATIIFTHSKSQQRLPDQDVSSQEQPPSSITSPSDIYKQFMQPCSRKSILKQTTNVSHPEAGVGKSVHFVKTKDNETVQDQKRNVPAQVVPAFTGTIVERLPTSESSEKSTTHHPTRVSRFKAQRLQTKR